MPFVRAARAEEIPRGQTRFYYLDGRPVLIAHHPEGFFAFDGLCPHKGFELDCAVLYGDLIDCPWHHYEYDVRTGENEYPKKVYPRDLAERVSPLPVYRVQLRGSEIWVELEPDSPATI